MTQWTEQKQKEFLEASKPLIKWLNENTHPHAKVIVDCTNSELVEGWMMQRTEEYLKD